MGNWYDVECSECGGVIHCHVDWSIVPDLCKDCKAEKKAQWYDVSCSGCGKDIRCHVDWKREPDLCKDCIAEKKAKWHDKSCECGNVIHYHEDWNPIPDLCKDCIAAKRAERAKWHDKSCECGNTIRYHEDWKSIPDVCEDCRAAKKAKWREARCAHCQSAYTYNVDWENVSEYCKECEKARLKRCETSGCGAELKYKVYWENIPSHCNACRELRTKPCASLDCDGGEVLYKRFWDDVPEYCAVCKGGARRCSQRHEDDDGTVHEYEGWGYINRQGIAVFVDDGPNGKHSHTVYNPDGSLRGHREEGHGEDWVNGAIDVQLRHQSRTGSANASVHHGEYHRFTTRYKDRRIDGAPPERYHGDGRTDEAGEVPHTHDFVEIVKNTKSGQGRYREGSAGEYASRTRHRKNGS